MPSFDSVKKKKKLVGSLQKIASVYQKQAIGKMKSIRRRTLETRRFLGGVAEIYNHAKSAYLSSLKGGEEQFEQASFVKRNGRQVVVFLSANERFYGSLLLDLWERVLTHCRRKDCDLVVVGKMGRYLRESSELETETSYFELDDEDPRPEQIKPVRDFISNYEQILVFHGSFETVFSQSSQKEDISGGVTLEQAGKTEKKYLFEPAPEEILKFFETEIIAALFQQTVLEHQLARSASRLMAMSQAQEKSKERLKKLQKKQRRLEKRTANKKQLEAVARLKLLSDL